MKSINSRSIIYTFLFAMILFNLGTGSFFVDRNSGFEGVWYYIKEGIMALGFLSFSSSRVLTRNITARRIMLMICNLFFSGGLILITLLSDVLMIRILAVISFFGFGYIGAASYYYFAMGLFSNKHQGGIMASGAAIAYSLQYIFLSALQQELMVVAALILSFAFVTWIVITHPDDWMFDDPLPYSENILSASDHNLKDLLIATGLAIAYIFCNARTDILMIRSYSDIAEVVTGPIRLATILGYICIGVTFDLKKIKTFYGLFLFAIISQLFLPFDFINSVGLLIFNNLATGIMVSFTHIIFWRLAPKTKRPELWSSFGRVLMAIDGGIGLCLIKLNIGEPVYSYLFGCIVGAFAVIMVLFSINPANRSEGLESISDDSEAILYRFAEKYNLTPRETDVMRILTAKIYSSGQDLADELGISRTMLYRYIKQINDKTDTASRKELVSFYSENSEI